MVRTIAITMLVVATGCARPTATAPAPAVTPLRPVSTYSIVARDPETGALGVAVQSHWFGVGSVVPWAEAGVGAVATQSFVEPAYGELGLAHMRAGRSAPEALKALVAGDPERAVRQVAMIDATGGVSAYTGRHCIDAAGHFVDEHGQFSVQANIMRDETVWPAMAEAYRTHDGDLADRLLAALDAAEAAGGDLRGRQSAALLIVTGEPTGQSWEDRTFDIRVPDHPQPLTELRRLVTLRRAYIHMNAGDVAMEAGDFALARSEYAAAERYAPHIVEIPFWHAVTLAATGDVEASLPIFRRVFAAEPHWAELVPRLPQSMILPDEPELVERILAQRP